MSCFRRKIKSYRLHTSWDIFMTMSVSARKEKKIMSVLSVEYQL